MLLRLLDLSLVIEIRLPEASGSITGSQWSKLLRVHLYVQRSDDGVVLLIDALSCGQADDSGTDHCNPHVWSDMTQDTQHNTQLHITWKGE